MPDESRIANFAESIPTFFRAANSLRVGAISSPADKTEKPHAYPHGVCAASVKSVEISFASGNSPFFYKSFGKGRVFPVSITILSRSIFGKNALNFAKIFRICCFSLSSKTPQRFDK